MPDPWLMVNSGDVLEIENRNIQQGHVILESADYVTNFTQTYLSKGPSINDVSAEGEGGGTPQKEMKGDIGRDPVFSRGDIFFKTPRVKSQYKT